MNAAKGLSSGLGFGAGFAGLAAELALSVAAGWLLEMVCLPWQISRVFRSPDVNRWPDCSHPRVLDTSFTTHPIGLDSSHWVLLTC